MKLEISVRMSDEAVSACNEGQTVTVDKLLVVGGADALNLSFAVSGDMIECMDQRRDLSLRLGVLQEWYQLIQIV